MSVIYLLRLILFLLCSFFFFKQKTAYEMRSSDWSSDVCSSDLGQSGEDEIPSSLQSSLLARLDRLGTAREIAQIASTIGREFGFQLLQEVSGVPESEVRTALSDLVCAGLIVPKDAVDGSIYVFRHALLQQAAQRTLLRERSQQLHALIGQTMEKRNPKAAAAYPELLAQHFSEGGLFDRAADYWLLAGTRADRNGVGGGKRVAVRVN